MACVLCGRGVGRWRGYYQKRRRQRFVARGFWRAGGAAVLRLLGLLEREPLKGELRLKILGVHARGGGAASRVRRQRQRHSQQPPLEGEG
jgi:hypothetical protein